MLLRIVNDKEFRRKVVVETTMIRCVTWLNEYEQYSQKFRTVVEAPIQNKVATFRADPVLSGILTQKKSAFDMREVMDRRKILLVNLAKGILGKTSWRDGVEAA
jgi:hypothetical protein